VKWLLVSDLQIPYEDPRAVALLFKVMKSWKPDVVDLLGDIDDQACYSRWTDGRPAEFLKMVKDEDVARIQPLVISEAKGAKEFFEKVRKTRPNAEIFFAGGNHDDRASDYFDKKLPEYAEYVTYEALYGLDSLGIDYIHYNDRPKYRYGDIYVHHGIALSQNAAESVRKDCESFGVSMIRGHSHRMGYWHKTFDLTGTKWRGWEIGHMSDIDSEGMGYTNLHNWSQGFAIGHIDGDNVHINLVEITKDYTCVVDGKVFSA
jgi:hypothetical protein